MLALYTLILIVCFLSSNLFILSSHSFEWIFNFVFYVVIGVIVMSVLGLDPLALFVSISTFVLAFSFMISRASSNYFEGLLFILCRRPYDIGVSRIVTNRAFCIPSKAAYSLSDIYSLFKGSHRSSICRVKHGF